MMATYLEFQLALRRKLPALLKEYRPDLLVVHHAQMPDLLVTRLPCPVVVTAHTTVYGQARGILASRRHGGPLDQSERVTLAGLPALLVAESYYWRRVRHALFVSNPVRREVMRYRAPLRTTATVANGLAVESPPEGGDEAGIEPPGEFLLCTGRLLAWKGLAVLLRAIRLLPETFPLLITGSGDVEAWSGFARSLGLGEDRVRFLGAVPRPDLLRLIDRATLFVFPSLTESCPFSLIEAMSFGKAIVATSVPGIQDMVEDGKSALLVPPGEPAVFASAIRQALSDPVLRTHIGRRAREQALLRFSRERMCTQTTDFFERVLVAD